jgi:hypothetical protein
MDKWNGLLTAMFPAFPATQARLPSQRLEQLLTLTTKMCRQQSHTSGLLHIGVQLHELQSDEWFMRKPYNL